jgi:putative heme iron utilization protein
MASNRSNANPGAVYAVFRDSPKQELTALARDGARIQIAAITAAGRALAVWAQVVDRFAETVGDELRRRVDGEIDSTELIARVTAATSVHLGELTALPRTAADHFDTRLARVPIDN